MLESPPLGRDRMGCLAHSPTRLRDRDGLPACAYAGCARACGQPLFVLGVGRAWTPQGFSTRAWRDFVYSDVEALSLAGCGGCCLPRHEGPCLPECGGRCLPGRGCHCLSGRGGLCLLGYLSSWGLPDWRVLVCFAAAHCWLTRLVVFF